MNSLKNRIEVFKNDAFLRNNFMKYNFIFKFAEYIDCRVIKIPEYLKHFADQAKFITSCFDRRLDIQREMS